MSKLESLQEHDVLEALDVELCRFMKKEHSNLHEDVLLAICLVSYFYRQGDVCVSLKKHAGDFVFSSQNGTNGIQAPRFEDWQKQLNTSQPVGAPGEFKPFILDDAGRFYLQKRWKQEQKLVMSLLKWSKENVTGIDLPILKDGLKRLFDEAGDPEPDWQQLAAANAVKKKLSVVSGGPGTGKTSTVVRILALLIEQAHHAGQHLDAALAAPTGKAAARLQSAVSEAKDSLNIVEEIREAMPDQTHTLHQLLGARRGSSKFNHHADNPLVHDVVIVDEASMIDQSLMSKLMAALPKFARLILLGDKDQLVSVEAGSVLGDICAGANNVFSVQTAKWLKKLSIDLPESHVTDHLWEMTDSITLLQKNYRFDEQGGVAMLADAINEGDSEQALSILKSDDYKQVALKRTPDKSHLKNLMRKPLKKYAEIVAHGGSSIDILNAFEQFCIFAAYRKGPWGINYLNKMAENILQEEGMASKYDRWYAGRPVIINANDYNLDLYNGDIGICLREQNGQRKVFFLRENKIRSVAISRLPEHQTAFALTVHKSQGSEFENVLCVLPTMFSPLLSRELIYTAVTRARNSVILAGNANILKKMIHQEINRSSGMREQLWN